MGTVEEALPQHANPPALSQERRQIVNEIFRKLNSVEYLDAPIQEGEFGPHERGWAYDLRREKLRDQLPRLSREEWMELPEHLQRLYGPQRQNCVLPFNENDRNHPLWWDGDPDAVVDDYDLDEDQRMIEAAVRAAANYSNSERQ